VSALAPRPEKKTGLATVVEDPTPIPRMPIVVGGRRRTPVGTPGVSPQPSGTSTPTPTPTPTPTSGLPGSTPTPTRTPTPTPTDSPTIVIRLRAVDWQWDFYDVPGMADGGPDATLKLGQTYELHVYNGGIPDTPPHRFSGNSALGISGFGPLEAGGPDYVVTFRPAVVGAFSYICSESTCGVGHDDMQGLITVLP
jgi:hypothetical protein